MKLNNFARTVAGVVFAATISFSITKSVPEPPMIFVLVIFGLCLFIYPNRRAV